MVEAYNDLKIPCWVEIEHIKTGEVETYRGWIMEIQMNTKQVPYKFQIWYGSEPRYVRYIEPKIKDGVMVSKIRGNKELRVSVDQEWDWFHRL